MSESLFQPGQRVSVTDLRGASSAESFKIVSALPTEGRPPRYRVKSDIEPFERIVDGSRLSPRVL